MGKESAIQKRWTDAETQILIDGYRNRTPVRQIAEMLGRTEYSVLVRAKRVGVKHTFNANRQEWSDEERSVLQKAWEIDGASVEDLAARLGKSPDRIRRQLSFLGLKRPLHLNPTAKRSQDSRSVRIILTGEAIDALDEWRQAQEHELDRSAAIIALTGKR